MNTCPKCNKKVHYVCTNEKCRCYKSVPQGEKPMMHKPVMLGVVLPRRIFNFLWNFFYKISSPYDFGMYELLECPYCGLRGSYDFWMEED